jgi:hypothetical protein
MVARLSHVDEQARRATQSPRLRPSRPTPPIHSPLAPTDHVASPSLNLMPMGLSQRPPRAAFVMKHFRWAEYGQT